MEVNRRLQVCLLLVRNYRCILTFSIGKVSTSRDENAGYESGDSNANGGNEGHREKVRILYH
jgi:hypothetical protein